MMMRSNFESSGYKAMKIKEVDRYAAPRPAGFGIAAAPARAISRPSGGLGLRAGLLGALCVGAVFALLGLLYSFG
jgi:hypothetical protein